MLADARGEGGRLGTPESALGRSEASADPEGTRPERVERPWGDEVVWACTDEYVGRILHVRGGEVLTLRIHEERDATLHLLSGRVRFEAGPGRQALHEIPLPEGSSIRIPPGTYHRLEAVTDATLLEVSTPPLDDVVRVRDPAGRSPTEPPARSPGEGEPPEFLLGLGSNLGDRRAHLERALAQLGTRFRILAVSRVVESEPWGPVDQPPYLNLVLRGQGVEDPRTLLEIAREAEAGAGRERSVRYGPRTLDVDLLFFGTTVLEDPELILPHPRWEARSFVRDLLPEVAGDLVDPRSGRRLADLPFPPPSTDRS